MRALPIFFFLLILHFGIEAQVYWRGGSPGMETAWNEPSNWSTGKVPGAKDRVAIPHRHHRFYPEIRSVVPLIAALTLEEQASLTIAPEGVLTIDAAEIKQAGLVLEGYVFNFGALILTEMLKDQVEQQLGHLDNQGVCRLVTDMGHIGLATQTGEMAHRNP